MKKSKWPVKQEFHLSHSGILGAMRNGHKRVIEGDGGCAGIAGVIGAAFYREQDNVIEAFQNQNYDLIAPKVEAAEAKQLEGVRDGESQEQATFHSLGVDYGQESLEDKDFNNKQVISELSHKRLSFLNYSMSTPRGPERHITTVAKDSKGQCHYVNPNGGGIFKGTGGGIVGQCKRVWRDALKDVSKTKSEGPVQVTYDR